MSCELTIEIDDPATPRSGGGIVSGTVVVTCSKPVACRGLEVTSYWSTHGRGNVDTGDVDQSNLFSGDWEANREYRYPFSLKPAAWPPTYYGTYLNVSHSIRARANVPWSVDPKATAEFTVIATTAPDDLKPTIQESKKSTPILGWLIAAVLLLIFGAMFSVLLLVLLPLAGVAAGCYWFFRVFLPRQITGSIVCSIEPQRLPPGAALQGKLQFTPKRNANIHGIVWSVTCSEKCVSGSGTNKTTHRHELFKKLDRLAEAGVLRAGFPQSFEFSFSIPVQAPPSLKFSDNELNWELEVRIDIPRWPDWSKTFPLSVLPSSTSASGTAAFADQVPGEEPHRQATSAPLPTQEQEAWFDEVVEQLFQSRDDPQRLQTILAAVRDQVFTIRAEILEQMMQPPASASHEMGQWMRGRCQPGDVPLYLLAPGQAEPPAFRGREWVGPATLIGFDEDLDGPVMRSAK